MLALDDRETRFCDEEAERVQDAIEKVVHSGVNLAGAALRGPVLTDASFPGVDLGDARLRDAGLPETTRADLTGPYLWDRNITYAEIEAARQDLWAVLSLAVREAPAIRAALVEGRVDGGTYYGERACLIGTIANARGCDVYSLKSLGLAPNRPIEHFFMRIDRGDTPQTNPIAKLIVQWIDEWRACTPA